jgi:hypothetical protein
VLTSPRPADRFGDLRAFGVLAPGEVHQRLVEGVAAVIEPCARSLREIIQLGASPAARGAS